MLVELLAVQTAQIIKTKYQAINFHQKKGVKTLFYIVEFYR